MPRLHGQAKDAEGPAYAPGARSTSTVYHRMVERTREAPRPRTWARQEAGAPHDALNCIIDRDKGAHCVFFLIQERCCKLSNQHKRTRPYGHTKAERVKVGYTGTKDGSHWRNSRVNTLSYHNGRRIT